VVWLVTYLAVDTAVRAIVKETLALLGEAAAGSLAEGGSAEKDEEGVDELHLEDWLGWVGRPVVWWCVVVVREVCVLMVGYVSWLAVYIDRNSGRRDIMYGYFSSSTGESLSDGRVARDSTVMLC
jgi:hypothetical protein